LPGPTAVYGMEPRLQLNTANTSEVQGDISLNFVNTDISAVVDQILGTILQLNYTIDPNVQGAVSLRTVVPIARDALIPTLQTLLAQVNAVLVQSNGVYRVMAADSAAATPNISSDAGLGGGAMIPLHYVQAASLAATLQPYIGSTSKLVPATDQNALIVSGDPASRLALVDLIQAFDVDALAGQSYELFPVMSGDSADFALAFTGALGKASDTGPSLITIVPLQRMNAVLVVARTQSLLADAQHVYAVLSQDERNTVRSWHISFLRNSRANDAAYILQQAFTPGNVTAQPTQAANAQLSTAFANQSNTGSVNGGSGGVGGLLGSSVTASAPPENTATLPQSSGAQNSDQGATDGASALLGPLSSGAAAPEDVTTDSVRIIPDTDNNSLLVYATAAENDRIDAMLDQVDVTPVEVRIDATVAEVDLDNALQYGTQFFFKSGGINAVLSEGASSALVTSFPGFVLSGHGSDAAPLAISLLQSVTKVEVLSSPELMVLNGQSASLQAGDLVPYLSQSSESTLTSDPQIVNSIDYRETGVILQVTPHVGTGGLVTMDVAQEVSGVETGVTTVGINSPTFSERAVTSRIAVQDGETIGLAGLISDSDSHANQGIPYLKNIPLLGDLFGNQNNAGTRKELLVLITPHVIRTQTQAADLTSDLQEALPNAAGVPALLGTVPPSTCDDPHEALRSQIPQ
jgi:general secretion pathway protein D